MHAYGWFTSLYDRNWHSSAKQLYRVLEPRGHSGQESTCQCRRHKRQAFNPWVRKTPCRRKWQPTQVFLLVKSDSQRTLAGYNPWGHRVIRDWATECTHTHTHRASYRIYASWFGGECREARLCSGLNPLMKQGKFSTVNINRSYLHDRKNEIRHSYPSPS